MKLKRRSTVTLDGFTAATLWWELTKQLVCWRGGYEVDVFAEDHDAGRPDFEHKTYTVRGLDWIGGKDRYVTLICEEESYGAHAHR